MKVKFGEAVFESSEIETLEDLDKFLQNLEGQEISLGKNIKEKQFSKDYELFDELTKSEMALMNLASAIKTAMDKKQEELLPSNVAKAYAILEMMKQEASYKLPPVTSEAYEELSKLTVFYTYIKAYLDMKVHARLGYGCNYRINYSGQIYILKDLRSLHKASIF